MFVCMVQQLMLISDTFSFTDTQAAEYILLNIDSFETEILTYFRY